MFESKYIKYWLYDKVSVNKTIKLKFKTGRYIPTHHTPTLNSHVFQIISEELKGVM